MMWADILCYSSTDWDGVWGSRQQVMLRFAQRGYRVLYIERPVGLEHLIRYKVFRQRKLARWREGIRSVVENLWIASLPPLLPGKYYSTAVNGVNQQLTALWTRRWLRILGLNPQILWLYNPEQGTLVGKFDESMSVYHCIDQWIAGTAGRKRRIMRALEIDLLRQVDIVFANSPPTYAEKRQHNPRTFRIPSGVDAERFSQFVGTQAPDHPALASIPSPRLGYSGHINERLDYGVLTHLAAHHPQWSLVLIGDTYPWSIDAPPLRRLVSHANVFYLGKRPYREMPHLLNGMDVCLMPYVNDERGQYRSPLKLYEYLAAGKPVVSTAHPEAREFGEYVYVASDASEFCERVALALEADEQAKQWERVELARAHSWDQRVDDMEELIRRHWGRTG